ncbi:MAG TPA: TolC family protein [Bryobacteraceae bacterium]|jgi:outer membrane protein|nr:TolC family protein [Bryobacteraceae bacterium]
MSSAAAFAEVHPLSLRQAVELALKENPDLVLSRLDQQKAQSAIRIAKDPFVPKLYAGSGLAKVWGYPTSIEGAAPAIIQTRTDMALFNRSKTYELARVRETARGAEIDTQSKSDQVAYQTATAFLDAQQLARSEQSLRLELESLERVSSAVGVQVEEGRQLPIENQRVAVDLARANQRLTALSGDLDFSEASLAVVLGYPATDRVQPVDEERAAFEIPATEQAAAELALQNNKDIRKIESQLQAKGFEVKEAEAARLPVIDAVAQYSLLARSNYENFFTRFQRNNGELGVSIQIPLLTGSAAKGLASQAQTDILELRTQMSQVRNRIQLDTQKSYQELKKATAAQQVARLDLDYTRDQVSLLLAQLGEGRSTQQQVDNARLSEQEKWIAFYDAQHAVENARLDLLRQTGTLQAALR